MRGHDLIMNLADPVLSRADLAVGDGGQMTAQTSPECAQHFLCGVVGNAADQHQILRHQRPLYTGPIQRRRMEQFFRIHLPRANPCAEDQRHMTDNSLRFSWNP